MLVSFTAVFIGFAVGANIRPILPFASSCPRKVGGLQAEPQLECTASVDWVGDGFNDEDCRAAVQRLYNVEVTEHGTSDFEFLSPGAVRRSSNPPMRTPRRYRVGQSCFRLKETYAGTDREPVRQMHPRRRHVGILPLRLTAGPRSLQPPLLC